MLQHIPKTKACSLLSVVLLFWVSCKPYTPSVDRMQQEWLQEDYLGTLVEANALLSDGDTQCHVLVLRASAYRKILKEELAKNDLLTASRRFPECEEATLELARLYAQSGDTTRAISFINRLLQPNSALKPLAHIELAMIRFMQDNFDAALGELNKATATDSLNALAWYYKGYLRSRFVDPDGSSGKKPFALFSFSEAMQHFNRSIALNPRFADAWFQRGIVHLNEFRDAQGLADLQQALRLDPINASYHVGRAEYYLRIGNWKAAIADADSAISLQPGDFSAWEVRAAAYRKSGNVAQAQRDEQRALQIRKAPKP